MQVDVLDTARRDVSTGHDCPGKLGLPSGMTHCDVLEFRQGFTSRLSESQM